MWRAHGTSGLLVMGSAGEATLLTPDERRLVIDAAVEAAAGKIPVFMGTTCLSTRETIDLSRHAERAGANGLLLLVPPYVTPSQEAIADHIAGNVIPREMAELSHPWRSFDDMMRTRNLHFEFLPLLQALYWLSNPVVVKAALRLMGLPAGHVRPPLQDLRGESLQRLSEILDRLGVFARYYRAAQEVV